MKIKNKILERISSNGSINIGEFIKLCQFEKDGYYIKNNPIGKKNDFITSPEISQMFGEIIATFIINYWEKKIKTNFNLVELGPGKGTLLNDILRISSTKKKFLDCAVITLIEKNNYLSKIQKKNVISDKISWSEEFSIIDSNIPSIIYSNEFFDCFPVRQFHKNNEWYEKLIKYNEYEKTFIFDSQIVKDDKILKNLEKFNNVKIAEISESRNQYFNLICKYIKKNRGIFLTIDYGYLNPPENFSLQTIFNHKKTHLFQNLGKQDISAHVDFEKFISIANANNLKIDFFCTQGEFLITCGILERKKNLQKNKNEETINNLNLEYDRLTNNSKMGKIFKVLVISCL